MPVGQGELIADFTLHTIDYETGDTLYLYTDGYADQFGGPKGKKFKYKALNDLLESIHHLLMQEQHHQLNQTIANWMGDLEQVDDICIVGIRL
jgi:serine phosphatase RsbU (regulator of sigma subunit)